MMRICTEDPKQIVSDSEELNKSLILAVSLAIKTTNSDNVLARDSCENLLTEILNRTPLSFPQQVHISNVQKFSKIGQNLKISKKPKIFKISTSITIYPVDACSIPVFDSPVFGATPTAANRRKFAPTRGGGDAKLSKSDAKRVGMHHPLHATLHPAR